MTDRELLEKAAKAAGIENAAFYNEDDGNGWYAKIGKGQYWRPLQDDGDALRLAVKLQIQFCALDHSAIASSDKTGAHEQVEFDGSDPYAATRRAIVRAAATQGEG